HPELEGMIPCYLYPADKIEYVDATHGRIPITFLNDNSYGSFVQSQGQNNGGTVTYAVLEVEFPGVGTDGNEFVPQLTLRQNYPNPFNPITNISFSLREAGNVSIEIFNVKGQKVKTLINEYRNSGDHQVVWNGTDDNNRAVDSGIYFYKMSAKGDTETRKMVLLK
ncbi:MAG: T9SS type A sorting domain-containing protein, partial [Candidatus Cloacimonetes bacterium]|nr:T9SS type A sorting domain-containing protein [Candidatus Cloacimonadota bacterium]